MVTDVVECITVVVANYEGKTACDRVVIFAEEGEIATGS